MHLPLMSAEEHVDRYVRFLVVDEAFDRLRWEQSDPPFIVLERNHSYSSLGKKGAPQFLFSFMNPLLTMFNSLIPIRVN